MRDQAKANTGKGEGRKVLLEGQMNQLSTEIET